MGSADEDWVRAAMDDDAMVVELLVKLHKTPPRRRQLSPLLKRAPLPLAWSVRQRRSKSISVNYKNLAHRASPSTPLSWSGATSFSGSGGGGCSEEFCRPVGPKMSSTARSKVNVDSKKNNSRRSRKKTLPELKEEEISLMRERRELKRELAALRKNLERQRATNEKLKRMKIELNPSLESMSLAEESTSQDSAACHATHNTTPVVSGDDVMLELPTSDAVSDSKFLLPDLNVPFDGPCSGIVCGVS